MLCCSYNSFTVCYCEYVVTEIRMYNAFSTRGGAYWFGAMTVGCRDAGDLYLEMIYCS